MKIIRHYKIVSFGNANFQTVLTAAKKIIFCYISLKKYIVKCKEIEILIVTYVSTDN